MGYLNTWLSEDDRMYIYQNCGRLCGLVAIINAHIRLTGNNRFSLKEYENICKKLSSKYDVYNNGCTLQKMNCIAWDMGLILDTGESEFSFIKRNLDKGFPVILDADFKQQGYIHSSTAVGYEEIDGKRYVYCTNMNNGVEKIEYSDIMPETKSNGFFWDSYHKISLKE